MEKLVGVLTVVLPVLAVLALGVFSRRKHILDDSAIEGIKSLVMRFMLPAVLLGAFYKAELSADSLLITLCMFICCIVSLGIGALLGKLFQTGGNLLPFLTSGFEAGMMGYGLYAMLFPAQEIHNFAMVDLGQVLFVFTVYSALLNKQKGVSTKETLKSMVTSPVFIAIVAGVTISACGLGAVIQQSSAAAPVESVLSYISAPTGTLMIFVVGYQLTWSKGDIRAVLFAAVARIIIMAGLCVGCLFVLGKFLTIKPPLFWAVVLMFTLPAPFVLPIFSEDEKQKGYVAATLSLGTILSIVFFAVISFLQ